MSGSLACMSTAGNPNKLILTYVNWKSVENTEDGKVK